jgi:hypothetical protein
LNGGLVSNIDNHPLVDHAPDRILRSKINGRGHSHPKRPLVVVKANRNEVGAFGNPSRYHPERIGIGAGISKVNQRKPILHGKGRSNLMLFHKSKAKQTFPDAIAAVLILEFDRFLQLISRNASRLHKNGSQFRPRNPAILFQLKPLPLFTQLAFNMLPQAGVAAKCIAFILRRAAPIQKKTEF